MLTIETLVEGLTTGRLSRRGFLQGAAAIGLSMSGAVALLEACTSGTQGTSGTGLTFVVWSYGVETIKDNIKKLEGQVSGLHVNFQDFAWTNYHDTMVARFAGKTPTDDPYRRRIPTFEAIKKQYLAWNAGMLPRPIVRTAGL